MPALPPQGLSTCCAHSLGGSPRTLLTSQTSAQSLSPQRSLPSQSARALKQRVFTVSQSWRPELETQARAGLGLLQPLSWRVDDRPLPMSSHGRPLCVSVSWSLLLVRTPVTLDQGPQWPHFSLITTVKTHLQSHPELLKIRSCTYEL